MRDGSPQFVALGSAAPIDAAVTAAIHALATPGAARNALDDAGLLFADIDETDAALAARGVAGIDLQGTAVTAAAAPTATR